MTNAVIKRKNKKTTELLNYLETINSDAEIIDAVFNISEQLDVTTACFLITRKIDNIMNLVQNNEKHELRCIYALHIILLALAGGKHEDVLNAMSDRSINVFKKCINVAQKCMRPKAEIVGNAIDMRSAKIAMGIEQNSTVVDSMMKSAQIALNVNLFWDEAKLELSKWSDAINGFKRTQPTDDFVVNNSNSKVSAEQKPELWTMDELSEKLGYANKHLFEAHKCKIIKSYPDRAEEIRDWFVKSETNKRCLMFKSEHFNDLKDLLSVHKARKKSKVIAEKPTGTNATTKTYTKTENKNEPVMTLVDIAAFVAYINGLEKLYTKEMNKLKISETAYNNAMQQANNAKPEDRAESLECALKANTAVLKHQTESNNIKSRLDTANKLLQDKKHAMETLHAVDAEITKILQESKQHQK